MDAVLASLDDLDGRPVAEHVAVFESAHDRLRSALADAGNDPGLAGLSDPCRAVSAWTPSWSAAGWPGRASTPAS